MKEVEESENSNERIRKISWLQRFLSKPEFGSFAGVLLTFTIFIIFAGDSGMFASDGAMTWIIVSSYLGVIAISACTLMIAGEFDLSIGSMIGFAGMMVAIPTKYWGWPMYASIMFSISVAVSLGFVNGLIVVRTKLPSFIVTLAFLYILRGLCLTFSIISTNRTIISGVGDLAKGDWLAPIFQAEVGQDLFRWLGKMDIIATNEGDPLVTGIPVICLWWVGLGIVMSFVLLKTRFGNWIFASGGDAEAAKNVGVPVNRVKILLFMFSAFCAAVFGICQVMDIGSAAADRGLLKEFEAIIAAVIGGTLLTGGYGSVVGACFGALIFGVVVQGIFYTDIDSNWFRVFLGLMLLIAVIFNNYIRRKVTEKK